MSLLDINSLHLHARLILSNEISSVPEHVAKRLIDYHISCSHGISVFTLNHLDRHGFFDYVKNLSPLIYDDGDSDDDTNILIKIITHWDISERKGQVSVMGCSRLLDPLTYNLLLDNADLSPQRRRLILENDESLSRFDSHSDTQSSISGEYEYSEPEFNTL